MSKQSFTLIELLITLSILAIIIGLLISIIKPAEIYRKSRDNQRIVDLNYLDSNIKSFFLITNTESIYTTSTSNKVFLSLQLPSFATNTNCKNYFPDLPNLPTGWEYVCSKNPTSTDGTGWIPIDFRNYMLYTISNLPLDPFNNAFNYYAFIASGTDFILYTILEDFKHPASKNDNDNYPHLYSVGTNKRLLDQAQGLVLYLPFDEGTGTIAYDLSGYGNNGTLLDTSSTNADGNTPPQWVDGKIGKALSFDGVDDYVEVTGTTVLDTIKTSSARYTFSAWINPIVIERVRQIFQRASSGYDRHVFALASDHSIRLSYYDGAWKAVGSTPISSGWHHVVAVFNTRDDMRVYVMVLSIELWLLMYMVTLGVIYK